MEKEYLMVPGPTPIPHEIAQAMGSNIFNHRGPRFKVLIAEVTEMLKKVFETEHELFVLTTSGTGAMEAGIVNFISPGEQVLALSNGAFGERFAEIARTYGAEVDYVKAEWGEPLDYTAIESKLKEDKEHKIKAILLVHNESSTGMMNDLEKISKLRDDHPALLIVDTISSLGAVPVKVDDWMIDVCLTGSQKALMIPPGLAFISVSPRAWQALENCTMPNYYFSLKKAKDFLEIGQTPFTPAIPQVVALKDSLDIFLEKGHQYAFDRHLRMMKAVREAALALGLKLLVKSDHYASRTVTAIKKPAGIDIGKLRTIMRDKYGVEIAGGQGKLAQDTFRIGHLGAIAEMDVITAIATLEMSLLELGYDLKLGTGVSKSQKVMMNK